MKLPRKLQPRDTLLLFVSGEISDTSVLFASSSFTGVPYNNDDLTNCLSQLCNDRQNHMYPNPFWIQGPWKENSRPGECNNPSPPAARTASSLGKPNLVSILMPGEAKWGITKLPSPRDRHHFLMRGFTSCASLRGLFNFIFKYLQQTGDAGLTTKCKV